VAAKDERTRALIWECDPTVAGHVEMMINQMREFCEFDREPLTGGLPGGGPGDALCTVFVSGQAAQLFEVAKNALRHKGYTPSLLLRRSRAYVLRRFGWVTGVAF